MGPRLHRLTDRLSTFVGHFGNGALDQISRLTAWVCFFYMQPFLPFVIQAHFAAR